MRAVIQFFALCQFLFGATLAYAGGTVIDFDVPTRASGDRGDYEVDIDLNVATNASTGRPSWASVTDNAIDNFMYTEVLLEQLTSQNNGCFDFSGHVNVVNTSEAQPYRDDWGAVKSGGVTFIDTNGGPESGGFLDVLWPEDADFNHPELQLLNCPPSSGGAGCGLVGHATSNPLSYPFAPAASNYDIRTLHFDWDRVDTVIASRPSGVPTSDVAPGFQHLTYDDLLNLSAYSSYYYCDTKTYPTPVVSGACTVAANYILLARFDSALASSGDWNTLYQETPLLGLTLARPNSPANATAPKSGTTPMVAVAVPASAHAVAFGSHGQYNDYYNFEVLNAVAAHEVMHMATYTYFNFHDYFQYEPDHVLHAERGPGAANLKTGSHVPDLLAATAYLASVQSLKSGERTAKECDVETRIPYSYAVGNNQCFEFQRQMQGDFIPHYWMNGHIRYTVTKDFDFDTNPDWHLFYDVEDVIESSQQYMAVYIPEEEDAAGNLFPTWNSCITAGEVPNLLIDRPSTTTPSAPSPWRFRMGRYGGGDVPSGGAHHSFYWASCAISSASSSSTGLRTGQYFADSYMENPNSHEDFINLFSDFRHIGNPELLVGSEETWSCDPAPTGVIDPSDIPNTCSVQTFTWSPATGLYRELLNPGLPFGSAHQPGGDLMAASDPDSDVVVGTTTYRRIGPGIGGLNEIPFTFGYTPADLVIGGTLQPQPFGAAGPVGPFATSGAIGGQWSSSLGPDAWSNNTWGTCQDYLVANDVAASALESGGSGVLWSKGTIPGKSNTVWGARSEARLPSIESNSSGSPTDNRRKHPNVEPVDANWPTGSGHSGEPFPTDMLHWMQIAPASESDLHGPSDSTYECLPYPASHVAGAPQEVCLAGYEASLR